MAAHHPAGTAQFAAVMGAHRILQLGIETIEAQTIAAMLLTGAVQVAASPHIQPHMGAALGPAEEDQIAGAEQAALTVMVGGDAAVLERVRPVLAVFGKKIVHCGGVGAGDAVKAVNNALLALHLWSTAEGLAALTKAGVRPEVALDVINTSSGRSNASMNLFPERVLTRAFPRTFRLALLDKDVGIAAGVAREHKLPTPMLQMTAELYRAAHLAMGEEVDHVEVVKWVEQLTGTVIQ